MININNCLKRTVIFFPLVLIILFSFCSRKEKTELRIVSPQCYSMFNTGEEIILKINDIESYAEVEWFVEETEVTGSGPEFTFIPELPGNYEIIATSDNLADTIVVLVRSGEIQPAPWINVALSEPMETFVDVSFGYQQIIIYEEDPTPVKTEEATLTFEVGQPGGTVLSLRIEADICDSIGIILKSYMAEIQHEFIETSAKMIKVPLVPGALNRILFTGMSEQLGYCTPVYFTVAQINPALKIPVVFQQNGGVQAASQITENDLQKALKKFIKNAKNVSKELAAHLNDVVLHNGSDNTTDRITGQIRISRAQLRDALKQIANEKDPNRKAQMEEYLKRSVVDLLLHEAGHRKAVKNGTATPTTPVAKEEVRNIPELIKRYIDLLGRLNQRIKGNNPTLAPDGAGLDSQSASIWFDRIGTMIITEMRYLQKHLKVEDSLFKQDMDSLRTIYIKLRNDLKIIRNNPNKTTQQKQTEAEQLFNNFKTKTASMLQRITNKCGKVYEFNLNKSTINVTVKNKAGNIFQGKSIPAKGK